LEHRASNPVSVKNLTAIETSTIVKLLRPYVPVGTKRTRKSRRRILEELTSVLEGLTASETLISTDNITWCTNPEDRYPILASSIHSSIPCPTSLTSF
jgi:hypothetical protein